MSSYQRKRAVSVNDRGHIIGEDHHRSKLTNHEVDLILELRDAGLTYTQIAHKFEIGRRTVRDYCSGKRRAHLAVDQKLLPPVRPRYRQRRPARPEEFDDECA